MSFPTYLSQLISFSVLLLGVPRLWAQGPPYQTDDPVPVDLHHYEFYIFGGMDGTTAEIDSTGPAIEFNWGAIPRVQLHAILPLGVIAPSNNPIYFPGGIGPRAFGLTDMELGAKIAFIKESKHIPRSAASRCSKFRPEVTTKGWGLGKSGTNSPSGCKRTSGTGPSMAERAMRWFRKPGTATFPTPDGW